MAGNDTTSHCSEHVANQIVLVQPLYYQDDATALFVVDSAVQSIIVPVVYGAPLSGRERLLGLERIINDDQIGAAPGQHTANRRGEPKALPAGNELSDRLSLWTEKRAGKSLRWQFLLLRARLNIKGETQNLARPSSVRHSL